jgi:hypothetical protein
MLFEGVYCALGVLQHRASNLCAQESRNDIYIQVPPNGPPTNKREAFTSFALIACNVVSWKI